jgi:3-(3-hydroxy-phenyl)propionate hydroxylase
MCPGAPASDAPIRLASGEQDWFVQLLGDEFFVVVFADDYQAIENLPDATVWQVLAPKAGNQVNNEQVIVDCEGLLAKRYDARPGTTYLFRPDQHVAARWRVFNKNNIQSALNRASLLGVAP